MKTIFVFISLFFVSAIVTIGQGIGYEMNGSGGNSTGSLNTSYACSGLTNTANIALIAEQNAGSNSIKFYLAKRTVSSCSPGGNSNFSGGTFKLFQSGTQVGGDVAVGTTSFTSPAITRTMSHTSGTRTFTAQFISTASTQTWSISNIVVTATPVCTISAPTTGSVNSNSITESSFTGSWNSVSGASSYTVDVEVNGNSYPGTQYTTSSTSYTFPNLSSGTTYKYQVRSNCSNGASTSFANTITTATTLSPLNFPTLTSPTGNTTTSSNTVNFSWSKNGNPVGTNYQIKIVNVTDGNMTVSGYNYLDLGDVSSLNNVTLLNGKQYRWIINATKNGNTPKESASATFYTPAASCNLTLPAPNSGSGTNPTAISFTAGWPTVSGATEYQVNVALFSNTTYTNPLVFSSTSNSALITGLSPATQYRFQIRAKCSNGVWTDWSSTLATPTTRGPINVDNLSGLQWHCNKNITWSTVAGTGNVTIELWDTNIGFLAELAINIANSGSYNWIVGKKNNNGTEIDNFDFSQNYYIKMYPHNTTGQGTTNTVFTIPQPTMLVTSPVANSNYTIGQTITMDWGTQNLCGPMMVELTNTAGTTLQVMPNGTNILNVSPYTYTVTNTFSPGTYKLKIYPAIGGTGFAPVFGLSPQFNIVGQSVMVSSPAASSTYQAGTNLPISYSFTGYSGNVSIEITAGTNGSTPILPAIADGEPNTGSKSWAIPANFAPGQYRIKVYNTGSGTIVDYSDVFTIGTNPDCPTCPNFNLSVANFPGTGQEGLCAAQYLCSLGIIKADQTGTYRAPTAILRRMDAANILVTSVLTDAQIPGYILNHSNVGLPTRQNVTPFEDLNNTNDPNADEQAAKVLIYLSYADDQNSITPFRKSGINFYPSNGIARVDYLKLIMETFDIDPTSTQALNYTDISEITGRPLLYIKKARELNLITDQSLFRPYDNVTREEAFLILARLRKNHSQFIRGKEALENTSNYIFEQNVTYNTASVMRSMASGNFAYSENGFAIPDIGLPLSFGFTYSSVITGWPDVYRKVEPLGVGWTHNFNSYILPTDKSVSGDNSVQVGQALLLLANGDGTFHTYDNTNNTSPIVRSIDDFNTMVVSQTAGVVSKYEVKRPDQVVFTYEKVNPIEPIFRLTQIADRFNNKLTFAYKAANTAANSDLKVVLDKVTAQSGRFITFNYDSFDKITAVVYPGENANTYDRQLRFGYYAAWDETRSERLEKFWTARHTGLINATRYKYGINQAGAGTTPAKKQIYMLQEIIRPKNNRIKVAYDKDNKIEQLEEGKEGSSAITDKTTFDRSGGCPSGTSGGVNCTIVKGSDGIEYKHFTNDKEILYQITSDVFTLKRPEYDASPRNPSWMSVNGLKHSYAYNGKGQMTLDSTFDKNGTLKHVQKWQYDDAANLWKYWEPNSNLNGDPIIEYNYAADKKYLLSMIQRVNSTTTLTQTFGQAANGQLDYIINAENLRTNFFYNPYGNVDHIQYVLLNLHSYATYDFSSRIKTSTNAKNQVSQVFFDKNDNIVRTVTPAPQNYQTIYRYDANDNPIEIENAKGKITYLTYDKYDRDSTITFGGATQKYYYNNDAASVNFGKITQIRKPWANSATLPDASRKFDFVYDAQGFLESNGYIQNITYKKSAAGLNPPDENTMLSIRGGTNPNHLLSGFVYDDMVRMSEYKDHYNNIVKYNYYADGKLFRIIYPGINYVDYYYDRAGRLTSVKWNTTTTVASYVYVRSRLDYVQYGNGVRTKYNYDAAGRFAGLSTKKSSGAGAVIADYSYVFDNLGNHVGENITEPYPAPATPPASTTSYTYNPENNQLTGINGAPVSHDGDGNVITKGDKTYVYDLEDNLKQILENGVSIATFEYDAFGNRRMAIRNGVQTRYVLDLLGMADVLAETDASNNVLNYYIHGLGLVARAKPDGSLHYYHGDFRGSVIAMTDASQTITHKYQYDEYGILLNSQEADANPFRYIGLAGIMHEAGDLTFMRARYYDPTTGRFNSTDPIWSTNLYPYAGNNPVMNVDVNGEFAIAALLITTVVVPQIVNAALNIYNDKPIFDNAGFVALGSLAALPIAFFGAQAAIAAGAGTAVAYAVSGFYGFFGAFVPNLITSRPKDGKAVILEAKKAVADVLIPIPEGEYFSQGVKAFKIEQPFNNSKSNSSAINNTKGISKSPINSNPNKNTIGSVPGTNPPMQSSEVYILPSGYKTVNNVGTFGWGSNK